LTDTGTGSSKAGTPVPPRGGKNTKKGGRPSGNQAKSSTQAGAATQTKAGSPSPPPKASPGKSPRSGAGRRAAQEAHRRRQRNLIIAGAVVAAVAILAAVLVITGLSSSKPKATPRTPLTPAELQHLSSVPMSTLVAATKKMTPPNSPSNGNPPPLTSGGKPEMLYIGAEFCPICATERWPMMVALAHFGTFNNVSQTSSAALDGNIPTLSFYGSSFASPDMVFTPVETTTNQPKGNYYEPLQAPTAAQQARWSKDLNGNLSFPYINMGAKYLLNTSQFPDTVLQGSTFSTIMGDVGNNSTTIGLNIDAAAGFLVRYLCNMTGNKPAGTCAAVANVPAPVTSSSSGPSSSAGG
jgi:hypothetical protein